MDSTAMRELGRQLLELGHRVFDEADATDAALHPDDVRQKKLENAATVGANYARTELYGDATTLDDLRHDLRDHFRGDEQLVERAVAAARGAWREMASAPARS
jgi:hypothetical protein